MDFLNYIFFNNSSNSKQDILNQNINNNNNYNQNNIENSIKMLNNSQINDSSFNQNKPLNIKENSINIYIENINQFCTIKIPKSFDGKICIVDNENELKNINPYNVLKVDSIIGIFNLNVNKYLGVITSSKEVGNLMDSYLYCIYNIELIKITLNNESSTDENLVKNIKNLFSTGNFYYSNNYDIYYH